MRVIPCCRNNQGRFHWVAITNARDLRTGRPVWSAYRHQAIPCRRLKRNCVVDVVVVGAGISGAVVSHALTERGFRPMILDRRAGARLGSTAASTALLQFELDTPLIQLGRAVGQRAAERIWQCSRDAVNTLRTKADRLGLLAHLHSRPSLYLAGNVLDAKGLAREVKARQHIGLMSELLSKSALKEHFAIDRSAAILSHGNLEADPVSLASGFLTHAIRNGARFHAPHDVIDIQTSRRALTLTTADGIEISARHLVLCAGYEFPKIVPMGQNKIMSTWAMATRPQLKSLWPQRALIWEASEPYLYLRSTFDGRVICGGEDEEYGDAGRRDRQIAAKTATLQKKMHRLFPEVDSRATHSWAGSFGASSTGTPTIGRIPGFPRCYAALGYGGNGITFSMLAATLLSEQIAGRRVPDAKLFEFVSESQTPVLRLK